MKYPTAEEMADAARSLAMYHGTVPLRIFPDDERLERDADGVLVWQGYRIAKPIADGGCTFAWYGVTPDHFLWIYGPDAVTGRLATVAP